MNLPLPDNRKPVQVGDMSFVYKGIYHPIYWYGDTPYRPRVECLVIKDGRQIFLRKYDEPDDRFEYNYRIPGGSLDNDCDAKTQAENEVNEETLLKITNVLDTNIQYFFEYNTGHDLKNGDICVNYKGAYNRIYIAKYERNLSEEEISNIDSRDLDNDMANNGRFYYIANIYKDLSPEHLDAIVNADDSMIDPDIKRLIRLSMGITLKPKVVSEGVVDDNIKNGIRTSIVRHDGIKNHVLHGNTVTLYSGSDKKFKELEPMGVNFGNALEKPGFSIFAWMNYENAKKWAIFKVIGYNFDKFINRSTDSWYFDFDEMMCITRLDEVSYEKLLKYLSNHSFIGYVYTIEVDVNDVGLGHGSSIDEYTIRHKIKPVKCERLIVTKKTIADYINVVPENFVDNPTDYRLSKEFAYHRGPIVSSLMINEYGYQMRTNKDLHRILKSGNYDPRTDDIDDLIRRSGSTLKPFTPWDRFKTVFLNDGIIESTMMESENDDIILSEGIISNHSGMKPIYVVNFHYNSMYGAVIRTVTDSEFNHSALALNVTLDKMYTFSRCKTLVDGKVGKNGFNIETIKEVVRRDPNTIVRISECWITEENYNKLRRTLNELVKHSTNTQYDYSVILQQILNIHLSPEQMSNDKLVCSVFVGKMLYDSGICLPKSINLTTPEDLKTLEVTSKNVVPYYYGQLSDYKGKSEFVGNNVAIESSIVKEYGVTNNGEYNAYVMVDDFDKPLRGRSEMLVVKDDAVFISFNKDGTYELPGGSWDDGEDHKTTAIRETQEEILINTKNVEYVGTYINTVDLPPKWAQSRFNEKDWWYGYYNEVYKGIYAGRYNGYVDIHDKDSIVKTGKFYKIDDVIDKLKPIHRNALVGNVSVLSEKLDVVKRLENTIRRDAENMSKSKILTISKLGKAIIEFINGDRSKLGAVFVLLNIMLMSVATAYISLAVFSALFLYLAYVLPIRVLISYIEDQKKFFESKKLSKDKEKLVKRYFKMADRICKNGKPKAVTESTLIALLEADDDSEDYTSNVDDISEADEPENASDDDVSEDDSEDYTSNVDDTENDSDDSSDDDMDYTEDTDDDSSDDDVDYTEDDDIVADDEDDSMDYTEDTDDNSNDSESDNEQSDDESNDSDGAMDDSVDYTEDAESGDSSDDSESSDDTEDDSDNESSQGDDSNENSILKNYNLMIDYQKVYSSLVNILKSLEPVVYPNKIQNSVLSQVIKNLQKIKEGLLTYIEFRFSSKYEENLYHYGIFIQAMKLNLEMLRKNELLGNDK